MPSPIVITARHFAKRAPSSRYSSSRSRRPSRPSVTFSLGRAGERLRALVDLDPGDDPLLVEDFGNGVPSAALWRIVSS